MFNIRFINLAIVLLFASTICAKNRNSNPVEKIDTIHVASITLGKTAVVVHRDTLFHVYGNIGSFTSKQRAKSIEDKIAMLSSNYLFEEDSVKLVNMAGYLNIMYQDEILMSIDSIQAAQEGKTKIEAAQYYRDQIVDTVLLQIHNTSWQQILLQIAGSIAIIIGEYFLIKLIIYGHRRARVLVRLQRGKKIKGAFGLIDDQKAILLWYAVLKVLKFLLVIIFLYLGLLALFTLFPYTKHISDELLSYVISPLRSILRSIVDYMPNLFRIIVIVVIIQYIKKFLRSVADKVATGKITIKGFYPDWASPTYNIVSGLLFIFMFILIFPFLPNSDSQIFQGVSVFVGIIFSLGSTSVVGNLISGLVITYMRPFKIGDRIKIGEFTGDVLEKTPLVTRIKTPKNEVITIPNSNVMSAQTVNYSLSAREHGLILYTTIGAGYHVPWQKVHEMLYEVANRTEHVSKRQKPFILQDKFNDFYVEYQLNVYIRDAKLTAKIYSDLRQHAQDVFAENGIEMVSPHYQVNRVVDGADSTVPVAYIKDTPSPLE